MENILASLQRIIRNKNFVTIGGVILILVLLYWGYSSQINKAVQPVRVPVATETIQPRTEITSDMITLVDMPAISVTENVIKAKANVEGKYSNINTVIPAGSMFYTDTVIDKEDLPDSVFVKVKKGEIVYNFPVDIESTYGNSIYPGNKIDIYMKTGNGNDEKVMLGKLVENVEVLAVKDSSGKNVFENTSESRSPSMMIFGVPSKIYLLLMKASYLRNLGVDLFPVPHGGNVDSSGATVVSTQQLADYIEAHSVNIPVDDATKTDTLIPTFTQEGKNVTIKYPKGCGYTYTCTYIKDGGKTTTVKAKKKSATVSKVVTFNTSGTLRAVVAETDGTEHVKDENITIETANTTNGTNTNNATANTQNDATQNTTTNTQTTAGQ